MTSFCSFEGSLGQGLLAALQSLGSSRPAVNAERILTTLLNELSGFSESLVLVLDDYHVIESSEVDQAVAFTLDHLPLPPGGPAAGGLHLIIATRTDPTLPLSRLRARKQLTELRASDLRFTTDQAAAFFQASRLPLSPDDVRTLESCTEGWITGLQLAAVAMQGLAQRDQIARFVHSFGGSHRYVIDYLVDEILDRQTPDIQAFLLQTSILERLTAPLCNAVVGREDSQVILEQLEEVSWISWPSLGTQPCGVGISN